MVDAGDATTPDPASRQGAPGGYASWLEWFYSLVLAGAFVQLGQGLTRQTDAPGLLAFAGLTTVLWAIWSGFSSFTHLYSRDDVLHRVLVFSQLFAVGGVAASIADAMKGDPTGFAIACAAAWACAAVIFIRAWRGGGPWTALARSCSLVYGVGAWGWLAGLALPAPWSYATWGLVCAAALSRPLWGLSRSLLDADRHLRDTLTGRYGLLILVVLGEAFVDALIALTQGSQGIVVYAQSISALLLACSVWWIYFDDVGGSRIRAQPLAPVVWMYSHMPLVGGITVLGVAIERLGRLDLGAVIPAADRWLLCGAVGLTLASVAVVDSVTERRQAELSDRARVALRGASALVVLLLAPAGTAMSGWAFFGVIALVCAGQVVFDVMMAPAADPAAARAANTADVARQRALARGGATAAPRVRRPDVRDAVRKGAPSQLRRDLYTFFIEGSWLRLMLALVFLYVTLNVFFASLYVLEPGCIANARPESFTDAFFFSVQTMSTIGYGALSPATTYGNIIVTVEAAMGLLGVALATGVMLAKVARPRSGALFSTPMVLHERDGRLTLSFRVGNVRGTEIVEATMSVSVLRDVLTPEGHHLRQLTDLKLVRERSPIFSLSWLVMHEIDDASPLRGINWDAPEEDVLAFICSMTGLDSALGQTVHARHIYSPEDIRVGQRFVDVISDLEDGRLMIDYERFHDAIAEDEARRAHLAALWTMQQRSATGPPDKV